MYQELKNPNEYENEDVKTSQVKIVLNTREKPQKEKSIYG